MSALLWEPFLVRRRLPKAAESRRQVSSWAQLALLPSLRINIAAAAAAELWTRQKKMAVLRGAVSAKPRRPPGHTTFVTPIPLYSLFFILNQPSSGKTIQSRQFGRFLEDPVFLVKAAKPL